MHFSPSIGQDNSEITNKGGKIREDKMAADPVSTFSVHFDGYGL